MNLGDLGDLGDLGEVKSRSPTGYVLLKYLSEKVRILGQTAKVGPILVVRIIFNANFFLC